MATNPPLRHRLYLATTALGILAVLVGVVLTRFDSDLAGQVLSVGLVVSVVAMVPSLAEEMWRHRQESRR